MNRCVKQRLWTTAQSCCERLQCEAVVQHSRDDAVRRSKRKAAAEPADHRSTETARPNGARAARALADRVQQNRRPAGLTTHRDEGLCRHGETSPHDPDQAPYGLRPRCRADLNLCPSGIPAPKPHNPFASGPQGSGGQKVMRNTVPSQHQYQHGVASASRRLRCALCCRSPC